MKDLDGEDMKLECDVVKQEEMMEEFKEGCE